MGLWSTIGTVGGSYFGPIGSMVGGALGGALDQDQANQYNSAEAASNRSFQERMSNTSYQRAMADMQKAGLNPMLAYSNGGASVPTGSMASYPTGVDQASASSVATSFRMPSEIDVNKANVVNLGTQSGLNVATKERVQQETRKVMADADISQTTANTVQAIQRGVMSLGGVSITEMSVGDEALRKYAEEYILKPEMAAALAKLEERSNQAELQKLLNMPAANAVMQVVQLMLKAYLGTRGSTSFTNHGDGWSQTIRK